MYFATCQREEAGRMEDGQIQPLTSSKRVTTLTLIPALKGVLGKSTNLSKSLMEEQVI